MAKSERQYEKQKEKALANLGKKVKIFIDTPCFESGALGTIIDCNSVDNTQYFVSKITTKVPLITAGFDSDIEYVQENPIVLWVNEEDLEILDFNKPVVDNSMSVKESYIAIAFAFVAGFASVFGGLLL